MVEVTFHHGDAGTAPTENYCCRLVHQSYLKGQRILIRVCDEAQLKRLGDMLWSLPDSFIPNAGKGDQNPPVTLVCDEIPKEGDLFDTLVVAPGATAPDYMGRFQQLHYLVLADGGTAHMAAREAFLKMSATGLKPRNQKIRV